MNLFEYLFYTGNWPPRWRCGVWSKPLGWTHITAELMIWSAYMAIPIILYIFIKRRGDIPFKGMLILFSLFIFFCGITHLDEAIIFYYPFYRWAAVMKVCTGIVSWITVIALIPWIPKILALPELGTLNELLRKDLTRERKKMALALETLGAGVWEWDLRADTVELSDTLTAMLHLSNNNLPYHQFYEIFAEKDRGNIISLLKNSHREPGTHQVPCELVSLEGKIVRVLLTWKVVTDENNNPAQLVGCISLITT